MIQAPALRALCDALGAECVREDERASVDGEPLALCLSPADAAALAAALAAAISRMRRICAGRAHSGPSTSTSRTAPASRGSPAA